MKERQHRKLRILFVDDERKVSQCFTKILEHSDFYVKPVYDGKQAMDELETEDYDIMITNLMMPYIDGIGLIDWAFRNINPRPYIVFHPCKIFKEHEKPALIEIGANIVLSKLTYNASEFGDIIRAHYNDFISYKEQFANDL